MLVCHVLFQIWIVFQGFLHDGEKDHKSVTLLSQETSTVYSRWTPWVSLHSMRQAKDLEEQQAHGSCTHILPHEFTSADINYISRPNFIVRMFWAGNGTDNWRINLHCQDFDSAGTTGSPTPWGWDLSRSWRGMGKDCHLDKLKRSGALPGGTSDEVGGTERAWRRASEATAKSSSWHSEWAHRGMITIHDITWYYYTWFIMIHHYSVNTIQNHESRDQFYYILLNMSRTQHIYLQDIARTCI